MPAGDALWAEMSICSSVARVTGGGGGVAGVGAIMLRMGEMTLTATPTWRYQAK